MNNNFNVYVVQIVSGANQMQPIEAFEEAVKYPEPSLIIVSTPCITHGLFFWGGRIDQSSQGIRIFWGQVTLALSSEFK